MALVACVVATTSSVLPADAQTPIPESPLSPEQSLEHFHIDPSLKVELVASEPDVIDPVAIAFDADERLWVVEMSDYPHGPGEGESPRSRIRILEDRDSDGRYESSSVFADGLLFANGVQPWRAGVIVTLAGEVAWMKDTDGDGRADVKETWFQGFVAENPQLRANHPTFAMDNRIYVANGLRGGEVVAVHPEWRDGGAQRVSISGRDFRFDPLSGKYEAATGVGQFGLTFDDYGNRFVCSNRNPCIHIVLENEYLARNPSFAISTAVHDVSPAAARSRVFPLSAAWTTSTLHAGQFTAACGVTIYRGRALRRSRRLRTGYYGSSFTCEPTGNLVHRDVLTASGATFTSRPGQSGVEFLATRDTWFRPVNTTVGPDGALYVVDMYRAVIEHPQFMPEELKQRPDLSDGDDRGRIYRIVPAEGTVHSPTRTRPLSQRSSRELVDELSHANCWQRETAARLLYERQDQGIMDELVKAASTNDEALGRIHALWALRGLKGLTPAVIANALRDPSPRVREQAVRLSEPWLAREPGLRSRVIELAEDDAPRLRFQVALSLGAVNTDPKAQSALSWLAIHSAEDVWTRRAVFSSLGENPSQFLVDTLSSARLLGAYNDPGVNDLVESLSGIVGARKTGQGVTTALAALLDTSVLPIDRQRPVVSSGLIGLGTGLNRRGKSLESAAGQLTAVLRGTYDEIFERTVAIARDSMAERDDRRQALELLRHATFEKAGPVIEKLATGEQQQSIRLAAIDTLSRFRDPSIADVLLRDFQAQTPAVRRALVNALLADEARAALLLDELEAGRLTAIELSPTHQTRLRRLRNAELRTRAEKVLASAVPADRKEVLTAYTPSLELAADSLRGRDIFRRECITCHKIGDLGVDVGPDIADSRTQTPAKLLTAILDPNRAVDANYFSFTVVTAAGKVLNGMIASETATTISLRQPENKTMAVLRDEIDEMKSDGISLMPVGFEKKISIQEMADLISFIKNWRYLDPADVSAAGSGDAR